MRSCRGPPMHFASWEASLAWAACVALSPESCAKLDLPMFPGFRAAAGNFSRALIAAAAAPPSVDAAGGVAESQDLVNAMSFCFWVTLGQALPWLLLFLVVAYLAVCMARVPLQLGALWIQTLASMVAYTHASTTTDGGDLGGGGGGGDGYDSDG